MFISALAFGSGPAGPVATPDPMDLAGPFRAMGQSSSGVPRRLGPGRPLRLRGSDHVPRAVQVFPDLGAGMCGGDCHDATRDSSLPGSMDYRDKYRGHLRVAAHALETSGRLLWGVDRFLGQPDSADLPDR